MKPKEAQIIGFAEDNDPIYGAYLKFKKHTTQYVIWVERNGTRISAYLNPDTGEQFSPPKNQRCHWHRYHSLPALMAANANHEPHTLH